MATFAEPDVITRILALQTWAVVGLSDNPARASYGVAQFLQRHGKRVIPVHPRGGELLGEKVYPSLADVPEPVDVVDVFRRSELAGVHADEAVQIGAQAVWFQLGVVDAEAYERTRTAGLDMVMDTCPKIEWQAYGPR